MKPKKSLDDSMPELVYSLYYRIANFNIQFNYFQTDIAIIDKVKKYTKNILSGFEIMNCSNPDITINIKGRFHLDILRKQFPRNYYISFLEKKKNNLFTIYYDSYHLKNILKLLLSELVYKHNGLILHGSSVIYKDKAILFLGKSGSGKTTTLNLLKEKTVPFTDDISIVRLINKEYYVFPSPLDKKVKPRNKNTGKKIAANIYFLKKKGGGNIKLAVYNEKVKKNLYESLWRYDCNEIIGKTVKNFMQKFRFYYLKYNYLDFTSSKLFFIIYSD